MDWGANLGISVDDLGDDIPSPPYQLKGCKSAILGCGLDDVAARQLLPPGLELTEGRTGGLFLYTAESGGGIAPFGATAFWIDVKGFDSPTGSAARFVPRSYFSGRAGIAIGRLGTARRDAETTVVEASEIIEANTVAAGRVVVHVAMHPRRENLPSTSGVNYYVFANRTGGLSMFSLAFSYEPQVADDTVVDISGSETSLRRAFKTDDALWAAFIQGAFTIGTVHPLEQYGVLDAVESAAILQGILDRLGTAAFIVDSGRRVRFHNADGRAILGDGISIGDGTLRAWSSEGQTRLESALEIAFSQSRVVASEAIGLDRPSGRRSLLLSIAPLTGDTSLGSRATRGRSRSLALVLVSDPEQPAADDPAAALQVMGLTKAEAQVAALIGKGSSPRAVAIALGKTEGTVRTDLKHVFSKLDLSRQSELALLVSRLGTLGF